MCVYASEAWHTGIVNNTNPQNFLLRYQIGLKLSVGTVLTSRQIYWSPNFSRTIDIDAIGKWGGKGLVLPHCIEIWWGGCPPCLIACSTPGLGPTHCYVETHVVWSSFKSLGRTFKASLLCVNVLSYFTRIPEDGFSDKQLITLSIISASLSQYSECKH